MKKTTTLIGLGVTMLLINSCSGTTDSDNIKTKGIYADYKLEILDNGKTSIKTSLKSGGANGSYLDLTTGDTLSVEVNGNSESLERRDSIILDDITYERDIMTDVADTEVVISFKRTNPIQELKSSVKLPSKVEILTPKADDTILSTDKLHISWTPSSDTNIDIKIDTKCDTPEKDTKSFYDSSTNLADDGNYDYSLSSIYPGDFSKYSNCTTTLKLTRYKKGTIDSDFDGGEIVASYSKSIKLDIR